MNEFGAGFNPFGSWDEFMSIVNRQGFAFKNLLGQDKTESWTPTLTFDAPGDLAITYTTRTGRADRIGRVVKVSFNIATASFTHTTAAGGARITGLPFTAAAGTEAVANIGAVAWAGITNANVTNVVCSILPSTSYIGLRGMGSGFSGTVINASDMPTGGGVVLYGTLMYSV